MDPRVSVALREAGVPFREAEPMARHTTMGVGGPAAVMAFPRSVDELQRTLALRGEFAVPHRILGGGSNLVVVDEGLDELVIHTGEMDGLDIDAGGAATADAGANVIRSAMRCCREGWRGLERAVGIPGSMGGAAVMNAGAYGFSISDILQEIVVFDDEGERVSPPEGWRFGYRSSTIGEGFAVARLVLRMTRDEPDALLGEVRDLGAERRTSQPGGRNAGCVFKNPPGEAAGRLIDELGLKGTRRGGAAVSERHANFVVNDSQATAADVLALVEDLREAVRKASGIELELEVKVWRRRP